MIALKCCERQDSLLTEEADRIRLRFAVQTDAHVVRQVRHTWETLGGREEEKKKGTEDADEVIASNN
jgi:hypothetical protein